MNSVIRGAARSVVFGRASIFSCLALGSFLFFAGGLRSSAQTAQALPYAANPIRADLTSANGWTYTGIGTDYADSDSKIKFDNTADVATLRIASTPDTVTFYLKGNGLSGSYVFDLLESSDGTTFTTARQITSGIGTVNTTFSQALLASTRYVRWRYTTKATGNIGMGTISISAGTAASAPSITTVSASGIAATAATLNGNVTSDGGASVTDRGVVYKTSASVTINDNKTAASPATGTGAYAVNLSSLSANQIYYFKAYAINSVNTSLGSELSFTTLANIPSAPTVANPGQTTIEVTVNANGNPADTAFAIETDTNNDGSYDGYVQAGGSVSASAVWQTAAIWGTKTVTGLTPGQTAVFRVKARNGTSVETAFGATASGTTSAACNAPTATTPSATPSATVCAGTAITLTANQSGGTAPFNYQWKKNGSDLGGATASTYLIAAPVHGDIYTCQITAQCGGAASTSPGLTLTVNAPPSSSISAPASVCASSTGNSASVPDAGMGATYLWTISGGTMTAGSTTRTLTFTSGASGSVTLNCTVTASTTCSSGGAQNTSVTINAPPTVTVNSPGVCSGGSATVTASPVGGLAPYSYAWTVPGGVANPGNVASFSADVAGTYSVIVTDNRGCVSASGSGTLTVNSFSVPGASQTIFSENMGAPGSTTAISANTFENATLTFTGTGDVRSTSPSSAYTGASGGGNVFLTTTAGLYFQIAGLNTVGYTGLQLSFGVAKSTTTGDGSDLAVEVSSDGSSYTALTFSALPASTAWSLRTATGTIPATANLRIRFRQTGTARQYRVDDVKLIGSIGSVTEALITPAGSTTICSGSSVVLAASAGGASYSWTVPVGATNPGSVANCTANVAGTYTVVITDANGCTASDSETVTTAASPTITLGASPTVCQGTISANLPYTGTTGSPDQYSIDFNAAANTAGFADVTATALGASPFALDVPVGAAAGTYTGILTVHNSVSGCSSAGSSFTVTVSAAPAQPGAITQANPSGSSVCATASGVTYTIGTVSTATSYAWSVPAGATITGGQGSTTITVDWTGASVGSQNVTVSAVNSCGTGTTKSQAFILVAGVPSAPTAGEGSNVAPTSFNLNWVAVEGVTGYKLDMSTSSDFSSGMVLDNYDIPSQATITYLKTGLTSGATYFYRVRAYNACGSSDNSATITVNTPLVIAGWDFSPLTGGSGNFGASPLAATMAASGTTVGGLTRGAGLTTSGTAAAGGWGATAWDSVSAAAAATANKVATFTVKADSGYQISFANVTKLDYRRSSSGPTAGVLQYSLDDTTFTDIQALTYSGTSGNSIAVPIDLSGVSALQAVPSSVTVTFRIVNYGASSASGTWYLYDTAGGTANDLEVRGTLCAVPTAYNVTGGGARCSDGAGVAIGLSGSQVGITYQLYRNGGTVTIGSPVTGTGSALSFGLQTVADTYTVVATRISGGCTATMTGSAVITVTTTPSAPSALSATPGVNQVSLGWTAPGGTVTGYNVKRSAAAGGPFSTLAAGANVSGTAFVDSTAQAGNTYYYVVTALNGSCESANSGVASATLAGPPPATPTTQAASAIGTTSFQANWSAAAGANSYRLDVATASDFGAGTLITGYNDLTVNATFKSVTGLTAGQTYYYRARAMNDSGVSDDSSTITVTLPASATVNITGILSSGGNGNLGWNATPGVSYDVYKSEIYPASWTFVETVHAGGANASTTVSEDEKRFFKVVLAGANVNTASSPTFGVIKPTVPRGLSMLSAPLRTDGDFDDQLGAELADGLPVGSTVLILQPGTTDFTELTLNDSGAWVHTLGPAITTLTPGQGFFVNNPSGSPVQLRLTGQAGNDNSQEISLAAGFNLIGISEGRDMAAATSFESALPTGSNDQNSADQIALQNSDGSWRRLIRRPGGTWYDTATRTTTTLSLTPGQAYYYLRRNDSTDLTF